MRQGSLVSGDRGTKVMLKTGPAGSQLSRSLDAHRAGHPGIEGPRHHGTSRCWCRLGKFAGHPGIERAGCRGDWEPRSLGVEGSTQQGTMIGPIRHGGFSVWNRRPRGAARWGRGVLVRSVAVTNAKGGVGKSTTAINFAAAMVELDRRVLLIDADPSGNAALGFFARGRRPWGWPMRCWTGSGSTRWRYRRSIPGWTWCLPATA